METETRMIVAVVVVVVVVRDVEWHRQCGPSMSSRRCRRCAMPCARACWRCRCATPPLGQ